MVTFRRTERASMGPVSKETRPACPVLSRAQASASRQPGTGPWTVPAKCSWLGHSQEATRGAQRSLTCWGLQTRLKVVAGGGSCSRLRVGAQQPGCLPELPGAHSSHPTPPISPVCPGEAEARREHTGSKTPGLWQHQAGRDQLSGCAVALGLTKHRPHTCMHAGEPASLEPWVLAAGPPCCGGRGQLPLSPSACAFAAGLCLEALTCVSSPHQGLRQLGAFPAWADFARMQRALHTQGGGRHSHWGRRPGPVTLKIPGGGGGGLLGHSRGRLSSYKEGQDCRAPVRGSGWEHCPGGTRSRLPFPHTCP